MVTTICDNCKAETSAYPPANHKNHVPFCSACMEDFFKKTCKTCGCSAGQHVINAPYVGGKSGACMTPGCKCKQFVDASKAAPVKAGAPRAAKPGEQGAALFVVQALDFIGKWDDDSATDMNILNVCRLRAILEGQPEGGYVPGEGVEEGTAFPVEPVELAKSGDGSKLSKVE